MGRSRVKRGKSRPPMGMTPEQRNPAPVVVTEVKPPIPELTDPDVVFGKIGHLPRYEAIPEDFKRSGNPFCRFVSDWFFKGRTQHDMARLKAKAGVDRNKALRAIKAILGSWAPSHEHKEAGCAYLLSCWFDLEAA